MLRHTGSSITKFQYCIVGLQATLEIYETNFPLEGGRELELLAY